MKSLCLPEGYRIRSDPAQWDDMPYTDEHQLEEYMLVSKIFHQARMNSVLDIGCGSGFKLESLFPRAVRIGVELPFMVERLLSRPTSVWINYVPKMSVDMLISMDAIEHDPDPIGFMERICEVDFKIGFISTPNRDVVRGLKDMGPPPNEHHVMEWNRMEFRDFLKQFVTTGSCVETERGGMLFEFTK